MQYSEDVKARVVADVLGGASYRQAAKTHNVSLNAVQLWVAESRALLAVRSEKLEVLDARMAQVQRGLYDYIEFVTNATKDIEYIRKQPAGDVAVLVGVAADKAERIVAQRIRLAEYAAAGVTLTEQALPAPDVS